QKAWIVAAVRRAALDQHAFYMTKEKSLFGRRASLPLVLQKVSRQKFDVLVEELIREREIVKCTMVKPAGTGLDVPGGPAARSGSSGAPGAWMKPDWSEYSYRPETA